ncbi:TPA: TRAP transporter large permease [Vibrio alginolyticus]|uniref:TRAP transporter large permease n=1 Tax=Vibrio TaxID=662 RepID=UPI001BD420B8|nr:MULTISPECIES: TRAP transporter large permease [Vibrio]EGQ9713259.1 TRAP transporter large permease [Vibrio alginolyticus]EII3282203.1 TRAP transporter large permease [Vibrio alginolyticus]EJL6743915.1 TRAP transporter large permease [Vibrio alginolyticus]MBT0055403.1 TRAP transporter large permease [Vibrio alginolyticus]MCA2466865.1 TRAP transporter large permease [Vibrio alginolyticus]
MTSALLFGSFGLLLLIGVPVGIALAAASMVAILSLPFLNIEFLVQGMVTGLDSFPLLAVVLFTLAGNLMSQGGISKRLLHVAEVFFGHFTGGLGIVAIVACMFFASISGTGSATVAAIGLTMIPSMVKKGYDRSFAGALIASSGGIGVIIPPSVVMIVYAITAEVSVTKMFMAGIIPGLVVGMVLIGYCLIVSKMRSYTGNERKATWAERLAALKEASWAMLLPVIILGGIYSGIFTPTESAAIGVLYGLFFGMFVYKELKPAQVVKIILESSLLVGAVLVIVGASVTFGRILTLERLPTEIAQFILSITENKLLILLCINVLLLLVGTFMETLAAIVILTPILLPITSALGMDPVHFGIVMIVNLAIGFVTPPLGANLFMASQVGKVPIESLSKAIMGWIGAMIVALMLITFIPAISLSLPALLS